MRGTPYDLESFGKRVRCARKAKGYTQARLAELINMTEKNIGQIERGINGVSLGGLAVLAKILDVSSDYLLLGEQTSNESSPIQQRLTQLTQKQLEYVEKVIDFSMEYIR